MSKADQLSAARWKKDGLAYWRVEQFNSFTKRRRDLFNLFDFVVMDDQQGLLGVNPTTVGAASAHYASWRENEYLPAWLSRGLRAELWIWGKRKVRLKTPRKGARGQNVWTGKRTEWFLRVKRVTLDPVGELHFAEVKDEG